MSADIPRSFLKDDVLILPLRSNLRFIAFYDQTPAGFVITQFQESHKLFIRHPLFQANGVGTCL